MKKTIIAALAVLCTAAAWAQDAHKKSWEFGIGGNVESLKRAYINSYNRVDNSADALSIDERDAIFGLHLYVARELNSHFFLDFQGNFNFASDSQIDGRNNLIIAYPSIGLQWRLGSYMRNKVIDPFARIGVGYQFRNFSITNAYDVVNNTSMVEDRNRHLSPISFGLGTNLWISSRWGLGLEADYLLIPQHDADNQWQGSVRVIYRLGGSDIYYGNNPADKARIAALNDEVNTLRAQAEDCASNLAATRMRLGETEKALADTRDRLAAAEANKSGMGFPVVQFNINSATIPALQEVNVYKMAQWIKEHPDTDVTITGYADRNTGKASYNLELSRRRAEAIKDALIRYGVSAGRLTVDAEGCSTQPYDTNNWNRAVIFTADN